MNRLDREIVKQVRSAQARRRRLESPPTDREIVEQVRTVQELRRSLLCELGGRGGKAKCPEGQEVVYVFLLGNRGVFKIGRTSNLSSRLSAHRRAHGDDIRVIALIACADREACIRLQADLHRRCRSWRWKGRAEWFSVTRESKRVLEWIVLQTTNHEWVRYANRRLLDEERQEKRVAYC